MYFSKLVLRRPRRSGAACAATFEFRGADFWSCRQRSGAAASWSCRQRSVAASSADPEAIPGNLAAQGPRRRRTLGGGGRASLGGRSRAASRQLFASIVSAIETSKVHNNQHKTKSHIWQAPTLCAARRCANGAGGRWRRGPGGRGRRRGPGGRRGRGRRRHWRRTLLSDNVRHILFLRFRSWNFSWKKATGVRCKGRRRDRRRTSFSEELSLRFRFANFSCKKARAGVGCKGQGGHNARRRGRRRFGL